MRAAALHSNGQRVGGGFSLSRCCESHSLRCLVFAIVFVSFVLTATLVDSFDLKENEDFLENPKYLHNSKVRSLFESLQREYPYLARAYSIGKTIENRDMNVLAITATAADDASALTGDLLKPLVKVTANIHGDETVGREMIVYLAQYLTRNYANVKEVQQLLNTTEIHLLPSCNPDGFAKAKVSVMRSSSKIYVLCTYNRPIPKINTT